VAVSNPEEEAWHASLPGVVVSAAALIGDAADGVLLVKPNYRDHWSLPGGICELAEPPHLACAREVAEELGLDIEVGKMLVVDWLPADARYGPRARPAVHFVFDGGTLTDPSGIVLQAEELDDWRFVAPAELASHLPARAVRRVAGALSARDSGCSAYVPPARG
jgi:8-oxo-dGTP pyrophosphatase MutT (NUDIX family)